MADAPITPIKGTFKSSMCVCKDTGFRTIVTGGNDMRRLKAISVPASVAFVYELEVPCVCTRGKKVNLTMGRTETNKDTNESYRRPRYTDDQMERIHSQATFFDRRHEALKLILACKDLYRIEQINKIEKVLSQPDAIPAPAPAPSKGPVSMQGRQDEMWKELQGPGATVERKGRP